MPNDDYYRNVNGNWKDKAEVKPPFQSEIGGPCSDCKQQKPTRSYSVMGAGYINLCEECAKK